MHFLQINAIFGILQTVICMSLNGFFKRTLRRNQHFLPFYAQQATYLLHASETLCHMTETMDDVDWRKFEKEIKACEVQGDALLAEFNETLRENILVSLRRSDLQTIAMHMDEFLDTINDSAKTITLYMPQRIDPQICDLASYINAEAEALKKMLSYFGDLKKNYAHINMQCERITELEHAADDVFAEYIGFIFTNDKDAIEIMKYKNIAEAFESATDAAKVVSDTVRKMILRYVD